MRSKRKEGDWAEDGNGKATGGKKKGLNGGHPGQAEKERMKGSVHGTWLQTTEGTTEMRQGQMCL